MMYPNGTSGSPSVVVQFQRSCLNWYWHSEMPRLAPALTLFMASGWFWHTAIWEQRTFLGLGDAA